MGWEVGKTIIGVGSIAADKLLGAERVGDITAWTAVCVKFKADEIYLERMIVIVSK